MTRCLPFLLLAGVLATPCAAALTLTLRSEVQLGHARILLADVAELPAGTAPALAALDLGPAPRLQQQTRINRGQIAQLMQRRLQENLPSITWQGADSVQIQTAAQTVSGEALGAAALAAVQTAFGTRYPGLEALLAAPQAGLDIPLGAYQLRARAPEAALLPARVALWLDVVAQGQVLRSVVVPVTLSLRRPAYVARRALAAGSQAQAADFEVRESDVAGLDALPVGADGSWRLKRPVQAGQVLVQAMLPVRGAVFAGDHVRLQMRQGGIDLEADAVAQADAAPGQMVAVRSSFSSDTVAGRLTAAGTVIIE